VMVSEESSFGHRVGVTRTLGQVQELLAHQGVAVSEAMLFGLSESLTFRYEEGVLTAEPESPFEGLALGLRLRFTLGAADEMGSRLPQLLKEGRPVLAFEEVKERTPLMPRTQMKLLVGWVEEKRQVLCVQAERSGVQAVSWLSLRKACASRSGGQAAFATVELPERFPSLKGAVRMAIVSNAYRLLCDGSQVQGLRAMQRLAEEMEFFAEWVSGEGLDELCAGLRAELARTKGDVFYRKLYAQFLQEAAELCQEPELAAAAQAYRALACKWNAWAKAVLTTRTGHARALSELAALERHVADRLYRWGA
jgi:hypothetical protein